VGGFDAAHEVVRVGDTVRRPVVESSPAVRALLLHLEKVGFDGAPRYLGRDQQGREIVSYIDGLVPLPPYPSWSMTDEALSGLGVLLRRFHEASASLDRAGLRGWAQDWADPLGGPVVCHNDVFPENVVFRDGRAVALIDFDMAAPGRPWWDLAIAIQEWAPLHAPRARRDHARQLDGIARAGRLARAYGIQPDEAAELTQVILAERRHAAAHIRAEIAAGNPVWIKHWHDDHGQEGWAADDAWLARSQGRLTDAMAGRGS
jgi:Phosphotransferase enzyme family